MRTQDGAESSGAALPAVSTPSEERPYEIVVVGGGAGGLELVTSLGNKYARSKRVNVTLIERERTHFWKPHLHEIAAGSMDLGTYETNYLAQSHWHHFRYRVGEMVGIDRERREVKVAPVVEWDSQPIGDGKPGPVARALLQLLEDDMRTGDRLIDVPYAE